MSLAPLAPFSFAAAAVFISADARTTFNTPAPNPSSSRRIMAHGRVGAPRRRLWWNHEVQHTSRIQRLTDAYDDPDLVWDLVSTSGPYQLMMSLAGYRIQ